MAIYDTRLARIIEALGRYYGAVSKEDFMAFLAFDGEVSEMGAADLDPTPEMHKIIRCFTDATEGGVTTFGAYKVLCEVMTDPDAGTISEMAELAQGLYRFVGEPDAFSTHSPGGGIDSTFICSSVSVQDMVGGTFGGGDEGAINGTFEEPDKFTPNLCALVVKNPKLTPAKRDTGAAGVFMNAIPTLEFSRCQPYLDVVVISPFAGTGDDGRIQKMGIMQFLLGQAQLDPESVDASIATALDTSVLGDFYQLLQQQEARAAAGVASEEELENYIAENAVGTSGMEMFTAPQTMVPVIKDGTGYRMETYGDFEAFQTIDNPDPGGPPTGTTSDTISVGGKRSAGVIDPFRPQMSIESFSIDVSPSAGMMSHKTAEISILMHDRSRLSEVAEFVKPDLYGHTEMMITYGWSHPDDSGDIIDGKMSGNFYGALLNKMRVTEKYGIVNSSFSFDEVGQVKIKLKLSMKGASNIDTTNISQGEDVEDALQAMKDLVTAIREIKRSLMEDASATGSQEEMKDLFGETFMKAASDTSQAMSVDEETANAIKNFISNNRNASSSSGTGQLRDTLSDLFGDDGTGGAVAAAAATIADAIAGKISHLETIRQNLKDPFAVDVTGFAGSTQYVNARKTDRKFVSLGALVMYMVGKPLAATRRFDEVQFIFYPVNAKASYLSDLMTCEIPIKIEDFKKVFEENTKTSVNLPLGRFMGMVGKEFIHNQAAYAYGLTALYETDEEGETKMKEEFSEDATKLNDEKKKRLVDAYGEGEDVEFKMPRIKFHIEAVPCRMEDHPKGRMGTILRIHVYDTVCSPYTAIHKLLQAASSNSIGLLSSAASRARNPPTYDENDANSLTPAQHQQVFIEELQKAIDFGLLEAVPSTSGTDLSALTPEELTETFFRLKGGFPALKDFISKSMPTIIYGSSNSAVLSADLSSMNNSKLASVNMLRGGMGGGNTAQGSRDAGLPLQTAPVSLSLTTYGCPAINYGQNFFVDFNTGTTCDNVFVVTGISHAIENGKFETKLKMTQTDAFGKYISMMDSVKKSLSALAESDE